MTANRTKEGVLRAILLWLPITLVSCQKQVRIPPSEYSNLDSRSSSLWEVVSKDRVYRVGSFTVTDSTLVLEDVLWFKDRITGRYPSTDEVEQSELPILLPLPEVEFVARVEKAKVRTILAVTTTVLVVVGGVTFLVLSAYPGPAD